MGSAHIIKGSSRTVSFSMVSLHLPTIHSGWVCAHADPRSTAQLFLPLLQKLLQIGGNDGKLGELFEFSSA